MPRSSSFDPSKPPLGQRRCPMCGQPLSQIDPTDRSSREQRTFECLSCAYSETVVVQFSQRQWRDALREKN
jgi:hypothetical protein